MNSEPEKAYKTNVKIILALTLVHFIGDFYSSFVSPLLPLFAKKFSLSLTQVGYITLVNSLLAFTVQPTVGAISDRYGYKPVFFMTHFLATPLLVLQFFVSGPWIFFNVFMVGFFIMATIPLGVAMAQKLAPQGRSMISSLMMGLAWGIGSMTVPIAGKFGDLFSIKSALLGVAVLPWLTLFLICFLPGGKIGQGAAAS